MKLRPLKPLEEHRNPIQTLQGMQERIPMEKIKAFIEQYKAGVVAGGVVAGILLIFAILYIRHQGSVAQLSTTRFRDAYAVYSYRVPPPGSDTVSQFSSEEEKYARAMQAFQAISDSYPGSRLAPVALYYVGSCQYRLRQYTQALDTFDQFVSRYPGHRMAVQAGLGRGDCLEQLGRYKESLEAYEKVAASGSYLVPDGLLGSVRCRLRLSQTDGAKWSEAFATLNRMAAEKDAPSGRAAREMRKLLVDLQAK